MKNKIYKLVVDVWRLAAKYSFQRMEDSEWKGFIDSGQKLIGKYRTEDHVVERLCRDLLDAFQTFYEQIGRDNKNGTG